MIYLLIFYWIFSTLFCFGAVYAIAKVEGKNIYVLFMVCLILGSIFFPMFLGRSLHFENYV